MKSIDVAVVGSGILGLLVAKRIADSGRRVVVFGGRELPGTIPHRDSQRNHTWIQSGLLYAPEYGAAFATAMWGDGLRLLECAAMGRPPSGGVFCFPTADSADSFHELAADCRLDGEIALLRQSEARASLGPMFQEGYRYFRVPDAPFPEQELMERLYRLAIASGRVQFLLDDVSLDHTSCGRVTVRASDTTFSPHTTVLCAGCGTPRLLAQVGVTAPLRVVRSPLLRIYDEHRAPTSFGMIKTSLVVDRNSGLAIVRAPMRSTRHCCTIIGDRQRTELPAAAATRNRIVTYDERRKLLALLPPTLADLAANSPATAGHKTEARLPDGASTVAPWVESYETVGLPGLIAALPGKATLALRAADQVLALVQGRRTERGPRTEPASERSSMGSGVANANTGGPDLQHHIEYPHIDESEDQS